MTTNHNPLDPEADHTPQDAASDPQDAPHDEADHEPTDPAHGREAAKWRRQLREVEADRDGLRARLDAAHRREVERLATDARLAAPADLWHTTHLDDLLDDAGDVDELKVRAALANLQAERPQWFAPRFGSADAGVRGSTATPPKFADAFSAWK